MKSIKVGIIGFGTVGAGAASILLENREVLSRRTGLTLELAGIADLDIVKDRGVAVPRELLTTDAEALIDRSDIVVELIGGTGIARKLALTALSKGKPVVTANKAMLALHGQELFAAAEKGKTDLFFEASVAGGIPIIKSLREGLVANRINRIYGIMNGTCNYILTRMEREGADFGPILADAQALGYAEAEPSLDIDGFDTAHKASILASLAYGEWFGLEPIHVEGIRNLELAELRYADELGYRIKLLAILKEIGGRVQLRVHPTLIPKSALLANIFEVFNGVMVEGDYVGQTLFYGRGAGRNATASAVIADVVDAALNLACKSANRVPAFRPGRQFESLTPMDAIESRYYLRMQVMDEPGVIAAASAVLARRNISISSIIQHESCVEDGSVSLVLLTHMAPERQMNEAIAEIGAMSFIRGPIRRLRIEDI